MPTNALINKLFVYPARRGLHDLIGLILPRCCSGCDNPLDPGERSICRSCAEDLPLARFHADPDNPVARLFHGRARLHAASAYLRFGTGGTVQRLLHALKYRGDKEAGLELGRRMAADCRQHGIFTDVDLLVPVPLHPARQRMRGYNQAAVLAEGMAEIWQVGTATNGLLRTIRTATQTRKDRGQRWTNIAGAFSANAPGNLSGRHLLLVDDVVTTGATLLHCIQALDRTPDVRLSVLTCAYA